MTDIIEAIDSATGCQQCGKDLTGSVSDDFCSEECQRAWQAARVGADTGGEAVVDAEMIAAWGISADAAGLALRQFGMSVQDLLIHVSQLAERP